jgi:poly(glycerol-phosphate) alpha-glucosyltransferase
MPPFAMPRGAYFSVIGNIRAEAGGQTRVALLRHRLFALHAGIAMPLVTYNPVPSYDPVRERLLADGLVLPDSVLLNMHEDLRVRRLDDLPAVDATVLPASDEEPEVTAEGYVWRRAVTTEAGPAWDYLRTDGSHYLRTPADGTAGPTTLLDHDGRPVGAWDGLGGVWRWWTMRVVPDEGDVFLLSDSRFIAEELGLLDDDRVHLLHQMHNPHLVGARRWSSSVSETYRSSMQTLGRLDALSTLTHRQRDDIVRRYGDTDNLVVIANPVEVPAVPDPTPVRTPGRIVVIARLDTQKRLDRAVEAFALLAATHPDASLDIYGDGPDRADLERQVEDAGLTGRVVLHGHDPRAADRLWEADLSWLTSAFEGYGLAILEARARACPVLAFDVPYGPGEQITSGVDGVLVPPADVEALARETAALLDDRARLEAMRDPARAGATAHGHEEFLADWAAAIEGARRRKPTRTRLDDVTVDLLDLHVPAGTADDLVLSARLTVTGRGSLDDVRVRWQAYGSTSPEPIDLPLTVTRDGGTLRLDGTAPSSALAALGPGRHTATTRLLLVWRNSAWQHRIAGVPVDVGDDVQVGTRPPPLMRRVAGRVRRQLRR